MSATNDLNLDDIDSTAGDPGDAGRTLQGGGLSSGGAAGAGGVMGGPTDGVNEVATVTAAGIPPHGGGATDDAHRAKDSLAGTSEAKQKD
jgi:hypothetical protein